jgi:uncharacterized protein YbjT (DUF2867 family)
VDQPVANPRRHSARTTEQFGPSVINRVAVRRPGTSLRGGGAVLSRAYSPDALERGAERERAAIADLPRDRTDGRVGLAQQISSQREPPRREERHRRLADQLGEATDAFARLAVGSGVSRLVLLTGRGEPTAELAEQTVRDSGAELTIVRAAWFSQNFSEDSLLEPVLAGEVALPAGDTPEPFVDADDIADVAVAALTQDGHAGQLYELTGPRLLTFTEAVGEIAKATGREVRYLPVSLDEYAAAAAAQGVPAEVVELLTYLFSEVLDGRNARVADGVRRALGREPRDFAVYARDTGASGVWDAPAANGADR